MRHPSAVSNFIRCMREGISKGYQSFNIIFEGKAVFPNACVPISGIIQHYKQLHDLEFNFTIPKSHYLENCGFVQPFVMTSEEILSENNPFDKIYEYHDSKQVANLTQIFINAISRTITCPVGVIEGLIWCLNEVMDNVLLHSNQNAGYVMAQFHPTTKHIAICVYDYGIGIYKTLKDTHHNPKNTLDAISLAMQEGVGDGKGQGNGLFGLAGIVKNNNGSLTITSGDSSIINTPKDELKKFDRLPFLSTNNSGTIVDFQLDLNKSVDIKKVFQSIGGFDGFDIRIDDMLQDNDMLLYNVYKNCSGTATRIAGEEVRNDVINLLTRKNIPIIVDFAEIESVSSSFIDEFIAKMIKELGIVKFNQCIKIRGMCETVEYLCNRSIFMRIADEWQQRK